MANKNEREARVQCATKKSGRLFRAVLMQAPWEEELLEQRQDALRRLIGDRQGLDAQLLLDLQRLQ